VRATGQSDLGSPAERFVYFFNPACDSLRKIQERSELDKVQKLLGVKRFGRSTLADAANVFDPENHNNLVLCPRNSPEFYEELV
jgi:hypothetical protein